jgi:acyl dehydratase
VPEPRVYASLDEFCDAVGSHLGHSEWREITQAQVDLFAEATGDRQWIHVDPEAARTGPFRTTVAHGYLTLSLVPIVLEETYRIKGLAMGVNYGCDKVRFPAPVPVGSRVRGGVELTGVERRGEGVQVQLRVTMEREHQSKPVCVADTLAVLFPATGDGNHGRRRTAAKSR